MINERYLEYLALDSILQGCVDVSYFLNNHMQIDLDKLKNRVIELQKEFLEPYAINSDSKE